MAMMSTTRIAAALAAACLLCASAALAAGIFPTAEKSGNADAPIEITADRLVTNNTEKWADFTGSVKATQGTFTLTSDALRIHYEGDLMNLPKDQPADEAIKRVVATGRVHIVTDEYVADAERAEYDPASEVITLTGENSRVVSGGNTLTGSRIVYDRREGKATVEGSSRARVKAEFRQKGKPE
jgi:lipopolysaccharide export system protein LptA